MSTSSLILQQRVLQRFLSVVFLTGFLAFMFSHFVPSENWAIWSFVLSLIYCYAAVRVMSIKRELENAIYTKTYLGIFPFLFLFGYFAFSQGFPSLINIVVGDKGSTQVVVVSTGHYLRRNCTNVDIEGRYLLWNKALCVQNVSHKLLRKGAVLTIHGSVTSLGINVHQVVVADEP